MIYQHGQHAYAIGMAWSDHVGRSQAKAHLRSARKPGLLAELDGEPGGPGAVAVGAADEPRLRGRVTSGAMAIGRLFANAVIRHSLADGRVWVARLASGVPCADRDELLPPGDAQARLTEPAQSGAILIGDMEGARLSVDDALTLYENQVADGRIDKAQAKANQLQPPPSLVRPLAFTAAALMMLALVAAAAWTWREQLRDKRSRQSVLEQMTLTREQARRRQEQHQQQLAEFRRSVDQRRSALTQAQEDPRAQWEAWERVRRRLPLSVNGYVADAMDCDRAQCTVHWKAGGPRVRLVDQAALTDRLDDGVPTTTPRTRHILLPVSLTAPVEQGFSSSELHVALSQALQFEDSGAVIGLARPDTVAPPSQSALSPVVIGNTGELRLAVSGAASLVRADDAVRAMRRLPVRLESARWEQLASSPSVKLDGRWIHVNH